MPEKVVRRILGMRALWVGRGGGEYEGGVLLGEGGGGKEREGGGYVRV